LTAALALLKMTNRNKYMGRTKNFYSEFLQLMARRGYYKDAVQTPFEFAIQLQRTGKFDDSCNEIMSITRAYEKYMFSPASLEALEEKEIISVLNELALKLK
ncbi:MAG TPA: DUF4129 domain-containing protein, partial [Desulfobacteria bacterium]|nr:DUF4129 domain-containing protein [Desulfobacteria bacterium]